MSRATAEALQRMLWRWRGDDPADAAPRFCTAQAMLTLELALGD